MKTLLLFNFTMVSVLASNRDTRSCFLLI